MDPIEEELHDFLNGHTEEAKDDPDLAELLDQIVFAVHYWTWKRGDYTDADLVRNLRYNRPWWT